MHPDLGIVFEETEGEMEGGREIEKQRKREKQRQRDREKRHMSYIQKPALGLGMELSQGYHQA